MSKFLIVVGPRLRTGTQETIFMQSKTDDAKEVVLSYIKALDGHDYRAAEGFLNASILVKGPAGEGFNNPREFIEMLQKFSGKYNVKKVFVEGSDVCLFYDFAASGARVLMCSWYQVNRGKIISIQTTFDPRAFA
ncbi:MAG: nuclear transport factor 2 family protein [Thaumarchaeota archaeon]|nr:nuclear transport factor 2 family protein [Nitrososphaerota archaeon]